MSIGVVSILFMIGFYILGYITGGYLTKKSLENYSEIDGQVIIDENGKFYPHFYDYKSIQEKKRITLRVRKVKH